MLVLLFAANFGLSRLVNLERPRRALTSRLSAAFGRPVEVGNFEISFLGGAGVVANYVTVSDDPRFGHEYFLRADRLSAGLRWTALLRGRLELDTVSFTRPSLNLVRNSDGDWNLESWFPRRRQGEGTAAPPSAAAPHQPLFTRITVESGRINFKRGVEKHPFAFVNLEGLIERSSDASWRVDLEASMMRAGVSLQEPGKLRLRGRFGSREDRIRPAELTLTGREASLSDLLRLARGYDFGVRGSLEMTVTASAPPASQQLWAWSLKAGLRLIDVHGWNLPRRDADPDLNLSIEARWTPRPARIDFGKILLEAPRSNVRSTGFLQWARPPASSFRVLSAAISLNDVLDWYRAFRPGVAPDLRIEGNAGLDLGLGGWPTQVSAAVVAIDRAEMRIPGIPSPLRMGRAILRWKAGRFDFPSAPISFPKSPVRSEWPADARSAEITVGGAGKMSPPGSCGAWLCGEFAFAAAGATPRLQDYMGVMRALAFDFSSGWAVGGPASLKVEWRGRLFPLGAQSAGFVHFSGTRLLPPFLNQPVILKDARLSWQPASGTLFSRQPGLDAKPGERLLKLVRAELFGARWSGSMVSSNGGPWEFFLSADRLEVAAINQWMNPRQQPGLLQRLISRPAARRGSAEYEEQLSRLRASGRVEVGELVLSPVTFRKLRGALSLDARKLSFTDVVADFYSGTARGSLGAELTAQPVYRGEVKFDRVNLAELTAATFHLRNLFTGIARGELFFTARGLTREDLFQSLEGEGQIAATRALWRGLDLRASLDLGTAQPGASQFSAASGSFRFALRKLETKRLELTDPSGYIVARGNFSFPDELDFTLHPFTKRRFGTGKDMRAEGSAVVGGDSRLTGTLSAPRMARVPPGKKP